MTAPRRALVTGADGLLGRAVVPALRAAGWEVVPLGRRDADVTDAACLRARAEPAALVVHLAFPTRAADRHARPVDALRATAGGVAGVVALAARAGAAHVILASSGKVYGRPAALPIPESAPVRPTTWLGRLKALQEQLLADAGRAAPFGLTALRIFNAWGPGQRPDFVIPHLLAAWRAGGPVALGELDHARDYVHVRDVAAAVALAAGDPPAPGERRAWNVGTGRATSVRDLAATLERVSGRRVAVAVDPARRRRDEPPAEAARCDALRTRGWRPTVSLEDGLCALWAAEIRRA